MEMSLGDREAYKAYKKYKRKYKELRAGGTGEGAIPETISTVCPNNPITYSLMPNCDSDTCQQVKEMKQKIQDLEATMTKAFERYDLLSANHTSQLAQLQILATPR